MRTVGVLLAAGQGTRMKSRLPKVLHPLLGRPLISYAIETLQAVTETKPILVIGHGAELIRQTLGDAWDYVLQEPQLGTGHAVLQTRPILEGEADQVLVATADMPLLSIASLRQIVDLQTSHSGPITMLTLIADDPHGFGRIVRNTDGSVVAIVEEAQASAEQKLIHELNAAVYCFNADWLWQNLSRIPISPKGEYYLTGLVQIAVEDGLNVQTLTTPDANEAIGINTRVHLAEVEAILRRRINESWMLAGVTIVDPAQTYIEPGVQIGQDSIIWPNTYLHGKTQIGENCIIGPNSILQDTQVGEGCKVIASILERAWLEDEVEIGPYAHLRPGVHLAKGVHIGNFGELKNSSLGEGTKMGHFSYVGDATIGAGVNIGAGTITCNYDGVKKHPTEIGAGAFIGSDTMLVAPVKVGEGAHTGAGAVVTKDVPDYTLAVGVPARVIRRLKKE